MIQCPKTMNVQPGKTRKGYKPRPTFISSPSALLPRRRNGGLRNAHAQRIVHFTANAKYAWRITFEKASVPGANDSRMIGEPNMIVQACSQSRLLRFQIRNYSAPYENLIPSLALMVRRPLRIVAFPFTKMSPSKQ